MEELNERHDNINAPGARKIPVNASDIIKKFRSLKDREMFCMEMSKKCFFILRFIFSKKKWF